MGVRVFIRRRPVLSYFALAYAISWTGLLSVAVTWGQASATGADPGAFALVLLANLAGPAAAALITSYAVGGGGEIARLFAPLSSGFRLSLLPLAVLFTPALGLLVLLGISLFSPAVAPGLLAAPVSIQAIVLGIAGGLVIGFLEEIGWMGFAMRRLTTVRGPAAAASLVGLLHGLWRLPAGFWGEGAAFQDAFPFYFIAFWILGLIGLRMLIAALYLRTQNLLLARLAHASYTGGFFLLWPTAASPEQHVLWTSVFALAYLPISSVLLITMQSPKRRRRRSR